LEAERIIWVNLAQKTFYINLLDATQVIAIQAQDIFGVCMSVQSCFLYLVL